MASAWHYMKDGKQCGPVSSAELKKLASSGELQSTDVLWKEGMADWVPACELSGLKGVFPEPAFVPASPPPPPPPSSSSSSMAPPPPTAQNTQVRLFSKKQKRRRILLIVASGIVVTCFLLPLFYVSVGSKSSLCFGWNLWFGIICFIIGLLSLASSIVDLVLQRILLIRNILKWVHLGTYSVITLCAFLGTILGIFGVGMKIYVSGGFNSRGRWMSLSDLPDMVSKGCIPIMSLILIGAGVLGLVTAIKIVRGDKA